MHHKAKYKGGWGCTPVRRRRAMLERFWEYISRHFKSAWKSVFFNFKQYCCFFAAIFIIQMLYGMMAISATNNNSVAYQQIVEEYDYHYVIRNLTQGQYNYLEGYKRSQNMGILDKNKQLYVIVDTTERYNQREGKNVYDVYLRFGKEGADAATVQKYYKEFKQFYVDKLASLEPSYAYQDPNQTNFSVENTLLLDYQSRVSGNNATFWIITALLLVLSVFLLMSIYNIRMNQYKFTYGVYMTFGADFKKLFVTAFWEMFVVMIVTFIPSVLVSTLVVWLIYAPSGFSFAFSGWVFFKVFVFSLFVVLAAVFMPMRTTSARQPMSLIITEDNSNLVTSPRKSFNLMGKKFPGNYEMYSLWRFRKYNIQLLTTAIVFCALFICGLYLANIYNTNVNYPRPQFNVTIDPNNTNAAYDYKLSSDIKSVNEEFKDKYGEELSEYGEDFAENFEALTYIEATGNATPVDGDVDFSQSPVTEAKYISSFMLVNKKNIKPFSTGFFVFKQEDAYSKYDDGNGGSYKVTNNALYRAVSEDTSEDLFEFLSQYTVEGDPRQILESKGDTQYIIIGDSISNISKFKFKVGDTIAVSTYEGAVTAVDSNLSGKNLLRKQIQNFKYRFTTLTVCAVIKDIPSGSVPVYMMDDVYESVTGRSAVTTKLNLYTYSADPADSKVFQMSDEQVSFIEDRLRQVIDSDGLSKIGSIPVADTNQLAEKNISSDEHYNELFVAISVLILCISPIIWFFSQSLYYFKREKEFNIIQSMGANGSDIRKIYLLGGVSMAIMSLIVSILLSYIASYLMFYVFNVVVPNFSGEYIRYIFYMPWYALVISVVMSVACGFFSAYIPYKSYFKNRYSLENGGSGVQDDE